MGPYLGAIDDIVTTLRPARLSDQKAGTFVDYGCGWGTWALVAGRSYEAAIGIDILGPQIAWARQMAAANGLANVRFINLLEDIEASVPKIDLMIAIGFMPVARADHVHQMFDFARRNLAPGGRFLINTYRAAVFFDQLKSLEHFSYVSFGSALRRYAVTGRSALETIYNPKIQNTARARAYYAKSGMIDLGAQYGLQLAIGPAELASNSALKQIDTLFGGTKFRRRVRWADWFVFEAR